jgi:molecular chaperone GrpE
MMEKDKKAPKEAEAEKAAPAGEPMETEIAEEEGSEAKLLGELVQEKETVARERDEFLDLLQRSRAEFDNYRRRNQNAREDARNDGICDTIGKFLPVLDNLERAAEAQGGEEALREGVQLVLKQFVTILAGAGVEEIEACNCVFDPNLHHAVVQEQSEDVESGCVAAVLQKGYRMGDRILRHCLVKVAE